MNSNYISNYKAAMYKTAMVNHDTELFKTGDFVSVQFIPTRGRGTKKFRCWNWLRGSVVTEVLYDHDLERFTL